MHKCAFCGTELDIADKVMRSDVCPQCGRDLRACVQCRFYDPGYHNQCRETRSETVRDRDKANLCGYFEMKKGGKKAGEDAAEKARAELEKLFKK